MKKIIFYFLIPFCFALAYLFVYKLIDTTVLKDNPRKIIGYTKFNTALLCILTAADLFFLFILFGKSESITAKIRPDFLKYLSLMKSFSFEELIGFNAGFLVFSLVTFIVSLLMVRSCVKGEDHKYCRILFDNYRVCRNLVIVCAVYLVLMILLCLA